MNTDNTESKTVIFRCPLALAAAMQAAAKRDYTNVSSVMRGTLAKEMRDRGLLKDAE